MARVGFPESMPLKDRYEFLVIGGGLAGMSAAIAAARLGVRVGLVQDRPVLGGAASSEGQVPITGANMAGHALARYTRETGIVEEFMLENLRRNPPNSPWVRDTLWWELVKREPNLTLYLNAQAQEAVLDENGKLVGCTVIRTSNETQFSLAADLFADCSGDGRIGADSRAAFRIGREGRDEFGESMAPEVGDHKTLPTALLFRARRMDHPAPFTAPEWAYRYSTDDDLPFRPHNLLTDGGSASSVDAPYSFWWVSIGGDGSTISDAEEIHDTLLRVLFGIWDHLKNAGDHGAEYYALDWISPMGTKRESRRFEGDTIVRQQDIIERTMFDDRVAYAGRAIDIHVPEGIFSNDHPYIFVELPYLWGVPFSSLYSRNVDNLLFAGRDVSVSHVAMGSTRVMSTLSTMGQAVGTAAYLCLRDGLSPRQIRSERIGELQRLLLRQDCYIPRLCSQDSTDLARRASISATSSETLTTQINPDDFIALDHPLAQMFPATADRLESVSLLLESGDPLPKSIRLGLRRSTEVNDFFSSDDIAEATATLPGVGVHWVTFELGVAVEPGHLYWVWLPAIEGVRWAMQDKSPLGTNRAGRGQLGERERPHWAGHPPEWFSERGAHLFRLDPPSQPYGPENAINGVSRPERWPNAWVSNPNAAFPQCLDLDFGQPRTLDTVHLTFDSDLDASIRRWPPNGIFGCEVVPQLVRDYTLYYRDGRGWVPLLSIQGNYQRHRVHRVGPVETDRLRVEVLATNGSPSACIFELRAYNDGS